MPTPSPRRPARLRSPDAMKPTPPPVGTDDRVMGLFSLEGFSDAMALNSFDQEELVTILIDHARSTNRRDSIAAIKTIYELAKDVASLSGRLTTQTATTQGTPDGKVSFTASQSRTVLAPGRSFTSGSFVAPLPPPVLGDPLAIPPPAVPPDHAPAALQADPAGPPAP